MKWIMPFFLFLSVSVFAQDKIVTMNSDTIDCKITYINETHVKYEIDGKKKSIIHARVPYVYDDGEWYKNLYHQEQSEQESIMMRKPEFTAEGVSKKQLNHIYSAGRFLEDGSGKIIGGIAVSLLSTGVALLLADQHPEIAGIVGISGGIVGLALTIGGTFDIKRAGRELQAFPYD